RILRHDSPYCPAACAQGGRCSSDGECTCSCAGIVHGKGIFQVPDSDIRAVYEHGENIEPVRLSIRAMPVDPGQGRPCEFPSLPPVNGCGRISETESAAGLHFDEGYGGAGLGYEIDVPVPRAPASSENAPPCASQPSFCDAFSELAELLAGRPWPLR